MRKPVNLYRYWVRLGNTMYTYINLIGSLFGMQPVLYDFQMLDYVVFVRCHQVGFLQTRFCLFQQTSFHVHYTQVVHPLRVVWV